MRYAEVVSSSLTRSMFFYLLLAPVSAQKRINWNLVWHLYSPKRTFFLIETEEIKSYRCQVSDCMLEFCEKRMFETVIGVREIKLPSLNAKRKFKASSALINYRRWRLACSVFGISAGSHGVKRAASLLPDLARSFSQRGGQHRTCSTCSP